MYGFDYGDPERNQAEAERCREMGRKAASEGGSPFGAGGFKPGDMTRALYWLMGFAEINPLHPALPERYKGMDESVTKYLAAPQAVQDYLQKSAPAPQVQDLQITIRPGDCFGAFVAANYSTADVVEALANDTAQYGRNPDGTYQLGMEFIADEVQILRDTALLLRDLEALRELATPPASVRP